MGNEQQGHTPGEWGVEFEQHDGEDGPHDGETGRLFIESDFGTVAEVGPLGPVKDDEDFANARLISAAPELLAMCKDLAEWETYMGGFDAPIWAQLRALIAKAEGSAA